MKPTMNQRQQLIQEIEQAPDDLVQQLLDFLHQVKDNREKHPLAKFAGILSDSEADDIQQSISKNCRQLDKNEW